jgi:hypothetical protein
LAHPPGAYSSDDPPSLRGRTEPTEEPESPASAEAPGVRLSKTGTDIAMAVAALATSVAGIVVAVLRRKKLHQ